VGGGARRGSGRHHSRLARWEAILQRRYFEQHDVSYYAPPFAWREERYPTAMGCAVEWIDRPAPRYPFSALRNLSQPIVLFEYHLDTDGSVARVDGVGDFTDEHGFTDAIAAAIRTWRAAPPARQECQGPWITQFQFEVMD
jgi:hypothetical protein